MNHTITIAGDPQSCAGRGRRDDPRRRCCATAWALPTAARRATAAPASASTCPGEIFELEYSEHALSAGGAGAQHRARLPHAGVERRGDPAPVGRGVRRASVARHAVPGRRADLAHARRAAAALRHRDRRALHLLRRPVRQAPVCLRRRHAARLFHGQPPRRAGLEFHLRVHRRRRERAGPRSPQGRGPGARSAGRSARPTCASSMPGRSSPSPAAPDWRRSAPSSPRRWQRACPGPIHVYFGVREERDVYGEQSCANGRRAIPNLHVHVVLSEQSRRQTTDAARRAW